MQQYYLAKKDNNYLLVTDSYDQIHKNFVYYSNQTKSIFRAPIDEDKKKEVFRLIGVSSGEVLERGTYLDMLDENNILSLIDTNPLTKELTPVEIKMEAVCTKIGCGYCGRCDSLEIMPDNSEGYIKITKILEKTHVEKFADFLFSLIKK